MLRGYSLCHEVGTIVGPYGGLLRLEAWRSFSKFIYWLLNGFESSNLDQASLGFDARGNFRGWNYVGPLIHMFS